MNNKDIVTNFLNLCIKLPNIGLFVFYFLFLLVVPLVLIRLNKLNLMSVYLPLLVPIAIVISQSEPKKMKQLYPLKDKDTDMVGRLSKLLLNFMAISCIMWVSVSYGINKNNLVYGVVSGIVSITVIFFISPEFIPIVIKEGDQYLKNKDIDFKYDWHKYGIGTLFVILLYTIDILLSETSYRILTN